MTEAADLDRFSVRQVAGQARARFDRAQARERRERERFAEGGFEQVGAIGSSGATKSRTSKLVALDIDGKMRADLPLKTAEGAYLYSFAYAPDKSLLGVGTDDKRVQLFELR